MNVLVVTGTDTGVGKTVVTAALAALAIDRGLRVAVVKPAQTGVAPGEPGDADEVRRLSGCADVHEFARYPDPLAPATAARRAGMSPLPLEDVVERIRALSDRDIVIVEGAGGVLVELGEGGWTLIDLATGLVAPVLVVARAGLGTLNHTALTCRALASAGVACPGVVIGAWPAEPDLAAHTNLADLPPYAGAPLLGRLRAGAAALDVEAFRAAAAADLDPAVVPGP